MKSPLAELNMRYFNSANGLIIFNDMKFNKKVKVLLFVVCIFCYGGYICRESDTDKTSTVLVMKI